MSAGVEGRLLVAVPSKGRMAPPALELTPNPDILATLSKVGSKRPTLVVGEHDILVNNMGLARGGGILDATDDQWQEALDQTLFPAVRASRLAGLERMETHVGPIHVEVIEPLRTSMTFAPINFMQNTLRFCLRMSS